MKVNKRHEEKIKKNITENNQTIFEKIAKNYHQIK